MEKINTYENYPFRILLISNLASFLIYGLGLFIMFRVGLVIAGCYLIYILILEYRLIRYHCVNCYYWGKTCGFGRGKISSIFSTKGDIARFCAKKMTWKNMIPDFLVSLIPLGTGIFLLIKKFDLMLLLGILLLLLVMTIGNGFVRGTLTCKYCKQRELGCPADELFNKDSLPGKV